jgi:hypothetical protein
MSATPAIPKTAGARARRTGRASALVRWITGGVLVAAVLTAVTIAVWPASETDKARADGEAYGAAVASLYNADTAEEVDAALSDMHTAAADTRDHAGDAVGNQVSDQADALDRAVDGFVGTHTSDDSFSVDVYQAELDTAVDDLASQADEFRTQGPEVQQAFWDGYQTGVNA